MSIEMSIACKKPEEPHPDDLVKKPVRIPGWPKGATMKIELGRKKFFFPTKNKAGLLEMKKIKAWVDCYINESGEVFFDLVDFEGIIFGLTMGLVLGVFFGLISGSIGGLLGGLCVGLTGGLFFGIVFGMCPKKIDFDYSVFNSTNLILFNQFREEIMSQVDKCLPSIREGQEKEKEIQGRAVEVLKEMVAEGELNLAAIKRVRRDVGLGEGTPESLAPPKAGGKMGELN